MWVEILTNLHCYHVLTTGFDFFIQPSYPDTSEPPILILDKKTRVMQWDEKNATLSEASVMSTYLESKIDVNIWYTG